MFARLRKIRADRRLWAAAQSFAELGELMARWLEGDLSVWPGYAPGYGPDDETSELIPVLAAANRAGFLTDQSQPGCDGPGFDGARWQQRAAVSGLVADVRLLSRIRRVCEDAGLLVMLFSPTQGLWSHEVPVSFRDGVTVTSFGRELSARERRFVWRGIGRSVMAQVVDAWQVTIIDLEDGRNDRLWPALAEALHPAAPSPLALVLPLRRTP
ncbi:DUF6919 domain-containing protein [Streptomyces sp. NPDC002853]